MHRHLFRRFPWPLGTPPHREHLLLHRGAPAQPAPRACPPQPNLRADRVLPSRHEHAPLRGVVIARCGPGSPSRERPGRHRPVGAGRRARHGPQRGLRVVPAELQPAVEAASCLHQRSLLRAEHRDDPADPGPPCPAARGGREGGGVSTFWWPARSGRGGRPTSFSPGTWWTSWS